MAEYDKDRARIMTGMFRDRDSIERAYGSLTSRGYTKDDVTLMMSDEARKRHFAPSGADTELGSKAAEGAGVGAAVGGGLGALLGVLAAIGTITLPRYRSGRDGAYRSGIGGWCNRCCGRRFARCAHRLGYPGRPREAVRVRSPGRQHRDGRDATQRRRRRVL